METKELRRDIIVALLSNPNHIPHITHNIVRGDDLIGAIESKVKPIDESTVKIAKELINVMESGL